jgi:PHD/YefM family antitoxin component YafN of YafNO toxin-antitoxin module
MAIRQRGPDMLEFTTSQIEEIESRTDEPLRIVNPQTNESFVLLRAEEYQRLKAEEEEIDDSPWTEEERLATVWAAGESIGWNDMNEYDDYPEAP